MNFLLLNQTFHPDVMATGQYLTGVALRLVERGHTVTVVTSRRAYDRPERKFPKQGTAATVGRVPSPGALSNFRAGCEADRRKTSSPCCPERKQGFLFPLGELLRSVHQVFLNLRLWPRAFRRCHGTVQCQHSETRSHRRLKPAQYGCAPLRALAVSSASATVTLCEPPRPLRLRVENLNVPHGCQQCWIWHGCA